MTKKKLKRFSFVVNVVGGDGELRPMADIEADVIRVALERYPNRSEAADRLGIARSTLYRRIIELDIPRRPYEAAE